MKKRGQIATFVIIGIIILAIVGVVLYFRNQEIDSLPRETVPANVQPVQLFVEECIQNMATPGIYILGQQGGRIYPKGQEFSTTLYDIAYGYFDKEETLPTIEEMQIDLSKYLEEMLPLCTADFQEFKNEGMIIEKGDISVETRIFNNEVVFLVDYPLNIIAGESKNKMQNFMAKVPVRLGHDRSIAQQIIDENQDGFVQNSLLFPDTKVNLLPATGDTIVVSVLDEKSIVKNKTFVFMFAYGLDPNMNPVFNEMSSPVFEAGKPVYFKADATDPDGDNIHFSTDSAQFSINPDTGEISTIAPSKGRYDFNIIAEDEKGGKDEASMVFWIV